MSELTGESFVGFRRVWGGASTFHAVDPAAGAELPPAYGAADRELARQAASLAERAFGRYGRLSGRERAAFLRAAAAGLEAAGERIAERMPRETGLPAARARGEAARTIGQLRLFADVAEEGSWVQARIDPALPDRKPLPRPDVRSVLRPLGPVAVFGASNFPLAFSVAGGDTAAALAAGCPVIVKAHSSHPGTAEIVAAAVTEAARATGMPDGVFSVLFGEGREVGLALVEHPAVKAVGFTGSRAGGRALMAAAAARPEPIPVYAEMSSINPIVILPAALQARPEAIARGLFDSVTLGVGQFCTNPGLVFLPAGPAAEAFAARMAEHVAAAPEMTMLSRAICRAYLEGIARLSALPGVRTAGRQAAGSGSCRSQAAVFITDAATFLSHPETREECFGPSTLLVTYADREELVTLASSLEGQLTATLHAEAGELEPHRAVIEVLERKAGRLIVNGFPTGVEVCHAMVHGGPYPATSDGRSTSVGTQSVFRFTRPVCHQNWPDAALPPELQDRNPLGIWRLLDGRWTRDPVAAAIPPQGL